MQSDKDNPAKMNSEVDRLVHEPSRYNIMALLYVVKRAEYLFVLNQTEMTSGNLTAHATKLEKAGYLLIQKKFVRRKPKTFLSLTSRGREAFENYRDQMHTIFSTPPDSSGDSSDSNHKN
jgi:DNA-binding MarR family transcriptional regulator